MSGACGRLGLNYHALGDIVVVGLAENRSEARCRELVSRYLLILVYHVGHREQALSLADRYFKGIAFLNGLVYLRLRHDRAFVVFVGVFLGLLEVQLALPLLLYLNDVEPDKVGYLNVSGVSRVGTEIRDGVVCYNERRDDNYRNCNGEHYRYDIAPAGSLVIVVLVIVVISVVVSAVVVFVYVAAVVVLRAVVVIAVLVVVAVLVVIPVALVLVHLVVILGLCSGIERIDVLIVVLRLVIGVGISEYDRGIELEGVYIRDHIRSRLIAAVRILLHSVEDYLLERFGDGRHDLSRGYAVLLHML